MLRSLVPFLREIFPITIYGLGSFALMHFSHLIWSNFLALVLVVVLFYASKRLRPEVNLKSLFGSILSGSFPGYSALLSALLFVVYSSWMADILLKFLLEKENIYLLWQVFLNLIFIVGLLPVFALSIPTQRRAVSQEIEPKKVLISSLSNPGNWIEGEAFNKLLRAFAKGNKALVELDTELKKDKTFVNWVPLLRSFLIHESTLERWYVFVSDKSSGYRDKLLELLEVRDKNLKSKVVFVPEGGWVDFDDYADIHSRLIKVFRELRNKGYGDDDVSVFISGGTSAMTLAFTIFAIKEGRQVEYVKQGSSEICKIDISFEDIYSFAPEERQGG